MNLNQKEMLMQSMHKWKKIGPWPISFADVSRGEFYMLHKLHHLNEKINDMPGVKISIISKEMEISKPAASQLLNSLENKGLIERHITKSDRRVVYVSLTTQGEKVLEQAFQQMNNIMDQVVERLGSEDTAELTRLFNKLLTILEDMMEVEKNAIKNSEE